MVALAGAAAAKRGCGGRLARLRRAACVVGGERRAASGERRDVSVCVSVLRVRVACACCVCVCVSVCACALAGTTPLAARALLCSAPALTRRASKQHRAVRAFLREGDGRFGVWGAEGGGRLEGNILL